jgi:hypothetical protein
MHRASMVGLAALFVLPLLTTSAAFGQGDLESKAAAEVLFREGMTAFNAGDYATACPKLESAVALTAGEALGGALLLAKCHEKQGKTASAWAAYTEVAGKARAAGQSKRAEEAEAGAAALFPKLHYLVLAVPAAISDIEGARLLRQGKPLRRELWSARIPIDPGTLAFEVSAPGKRSATRTVQIPADPGETKVAFDALEDEPATPPPKPPAPPEAAPPVTPPTAAPSATATVPVRPDTPPGGSGGQRFAGIVIAAAGIAGIGAGIGVGAAAKGNYDAAVSETPNCTPRPGGGFECKDATKVNDARALGDAGTGVFFAGAGALLGGALLFFLAPAQPRTKAALPRVTFGRDGGAITWIGAF